MLCLKRLNILNMPEVRFKGKIIKCEKGANLRKVLLENGLSPHNGNSHMVSCFGIGTCGTCAVKLTGTTNPISKKERIRLSMAPHQLSSGLRLACQVQVFHNLAVEKGEGFWGQHI
jgi:ferredoxin